MFHPSDISVFFSLKEFHSFHSQLMDRLTTAIKTAWEYGGDASFAGDGARTWHLEHSLMQIDFDQMFQALKHIEYDQSNDSVTVILPITIENRLKRVHLPSDKPPPSESLAQQFAAEQTCAQKDPTVCVAQFDRVVQDLLKAYSSCIEGQDPNLSAWLSQIDTELLKAYSSCFEGQGPPVSSMSTWLSEINPHDLHPSLSRALPVGEWLETTTGTQALLAEGISCEGPVHVLLRTGKVKPPSQRGS